MDREGLLLLLLLQGRLRLCDGFDGRVFAFLIATLMESTQLALLETARITCQATQRMVYVFK